MFIREADEVAAWISDREAVASSEELGRDLEHVEMLQKTFADFMKDLEANQARIEKLSSQAKKLLGEKHPDSDMIETRLEAVCQSWSELTSLAQTREEKLAGAHEIQKFNRSENCSRTMHMYYIVRSNKIQTFSGRRQNSKKEHKEGASIERHVS